MSPLLYVFCTSPVRGAMLLSVPKPVLLLAFLVSPAHLLQTASFRLLLFEYPYHRGCHIRVISFQRRESALYIVPRTGRGSLLKRTLGPILVPSAVRSPRARSRLSVLNLRRN
ncbi:hypothetical protein BDW69DRAFT_7759 [Aspergillus filifer]